MSLGVVEDQSYSQDVDTTATGGAFDVAQKVSPGAKTRPFSKSKVNHDD